MNIVPGSVHQALAGFGRPLESGLRQDMEQCFRRDFSNVRVHTGAAAEQSAQDVNAHAFTVGHQMVFGAGKFVPGTAEGRGLIAHELAHVVQQTGPTSRRNQSSSLLIQRSPDDKKGSASGAEDTPYPEEHEVVGYAVQLLEEGALKDGTVFYDGKYWKAIGISGTAFVVGPFSSDMGQFFYVYRLKGSGKAKGGRVLSRGIYLGGWGRTSKITPELRDQFARVEGSKELQVELSSSGSREPRDSLPFMMTVWKARGLLDRGRLPQGVDPIPAFPVTENQAKQLKRDLASGAAATMLAGLVLAGRTGAAASGSVAGAGADVAVATQFARGTGAFPAVTEPGTVGTAEAGGAALEEEGATVVGRAVGSPKIGAGAAVAVAILLHESPNPAGQWDGTVSEITGSGRATPGEYEWETRLTPQQRRYVRDLWNQRHSTPGPIIPIQEPQPQPAEQKNAEPKTKTDVRPIPRPDVDIDLDKRRRRRQRGCYYQAIEQQFGRYPCHAEYARSLSGVSREMRITTPEMETADFDAMDWAGNLYEVKTGYRWLPFTPNEEARRRTIQRFFVQATNQIIVADRCGHPLRWYFNDDVAASFFGAENAATSYVQAPLPVPTWYMPFPCTEDSDG
jgi:hypothetical protein